MADLMVYLSELEKINRMGRFTGMWKEIEENTAAGAGGHTGAGPPWSGAGRDETTHEGSVSASSLYKRAVEKYEVGEGIVLTLLARLHVLKGRIGRTCR